MLHPAAVPRAVPAEEVDGNAILCVDIRNQSAMNHRQVEYEGSAMPLLPVMLGRFRRRLSNAILLMLDWIWMLAALFELGLIEPGRHIGVVEIRTANIFDRA